jgi:ribose 5-phosphate isomerase B
MERIIIGSDHAGVDLKDYLKAHLERLGHEVVDKGTHTHDSVDYPDFAHAVAAEVAAGGDVLGVVICGSGNGVNISANRHRGVRSALAWIPEIAALAREHNDANVLALPARFVSKEEALAILDAFLAARFEGGRHERRIRKIDA